MILPRIIVLRLMNSKQKPANLLEGMYAPLYTTNSKGVPSIEAEESGGIPPPFLIVASRPL